MTADKSLMLLSCNKIMLFSADSYDHIRDDKTPVPKTSSSNEQFRAAASNCSPSSRPVNLHPGLSSDVTSQMTSLSHHNVRGTIPCLF